MVGVDKCFLKSVYHSAIIYNNWYIPTLALKINNCYVGYIHKYILIFESEGVYNT